jgi:hypothetical protein
LESSGITSPTTSSFLLPAGGTYVLTSCLTYCSGGTTYRWANITSGSKVFIGEAGDIANATPVAGIAIAYISTTVATTVALCVTSGPSPIRGQSYDASARGPWVSIQSLRNNNTITAFTGATSSTAGSIGYIPAPIAGDQTKFLCGDGNWQSAVKTYMNASIGTTITSNKLTFSLYTIVPTCQYPFILTNSTTFTSPNISGVYIINLIINVLGCTSAPSITPSVGGTSTGQVFYGGYAPGLALPLCGTCIINIPANTTLSFNTSAITGIGYIGMLTITNLT